MKKYLGYFMLVIAIVPVAMFLGIHEIAFFTNTFAAESQSMAPLGYMLTGGGIFVWIGIMLWHAETGLQKATSFGMVIICVFGSLAAALFNMYMVTMSDAGFSLTKGDIKSMTLLIGVLATIHMIAAVLEFAGAAMIQAFGDDDEDGIPNIIDPDYKLNLNELETRLAELSKENDDLRAKTSPDPKDSSGKI